MLVRAGALLSNSPVRAGALLSKSPFRADALLRKSPSARAVFLQCSCTQERGGEGCEGLPPPLPPQFHIHYESWSDCVQERTYFVYHAESAHLFICHSFITKIFHISYSSNLVSQSVSVCPSVYMYLCSTDLRSLYLSLPITNQNISCFSILLNLKLLDRIGPEVHTDLGLYFLILAQVYHAYKLYIS